ncbi:unnamed protein product [Calypogeia fissa]
MAYDAKWIPQVAASIFFFIVLLQVPFFRVPCRTGVCKTPLQVSVGQMAASDIVPEAVLKGFLYPGAIFRHLYQGDTLAPIWGNLLQEYNLTGDFEPASAAYKYRLEVVAGSYFAVGGAIVSLIRPGRMGMFGLLLIIWGLIKDGMFERAGNVGKDPANLVHAEPTLFLALALALLSVRYDMKKVSRLGAPLARPLRSSAKSKLKTK